jgi:hypothetical protein
MSIQSSVFVDFAQKLYTMAPAAQKALVGEADDDGNLTRLANSPDGLKNISFKHIFANMAYQPYQPKPFKDLSESIRKEISTSVRNDLNHLRALATAALNESQFALDNLQNQGSLDSQIELTKRKLTVLRAARGDDVIEEMDDVAADQAFQQQEMQRFGRRVAFCDAVLAHKDLNSEELAPAKSWYQKKLGELLGHTITYGHTVAFVALAAAVSVARSHFDF